MALPATQSNHGTLAERVSRALGHAAQIPTAHESACLLLDVSGSMAEECEPGRSKITALREIVGTLPCHAIYAFAEAVARCHPARIPDPAGQTMMAIAFQRIKRDHHTSAVLITDGIPSEPEDVVLRAAAGLRLDIFYVGPTPKPDFLDRLAHACKGRAHQTTLRRTGTEQLTTRICALLESGEVR